MEKKKLKTLSIVSLIISVLPLTTLIPVSLKITLPEGVNTVWAGGNAACASLLMVGMVVLALFLIL